MYIKSACLELRLKILKWINSRSAGAFIDKHLCLSKK